MSFIEENKNDKSIIQENLYPPFRYGIVHPGIYRGAYPTLPNFRFLSRLQLKTIISLTPEDPINDLKAFAEMAGVTIRHYPISRNAPLSEVMSLYDAANIVFDPENHPIYIHCLDGRRITSLLVLLIRKLQGWKTLPAIVEYWRFQVLGRSPIPTIEIEKMSRDLEKLFNESAEVNSS